MTSEELEVGDILIWLEDEYIITELKDKKIIHTLVGGTDICYVSFENANGLFSDGSLTCKRSTKSTQPKTTHRNNDGISTCCFCGGATRKCGGMMFNRDYRVCVVCGK